MSRASALRDRIRFDQRAMQKGVRMGPWEDGFTVWAETTPLRGGEGVVAQRLEGHQPVIFTVRDTAATRQISAAYRAVDRRTGVTYNVSTNTPAKTRGFRDILATSGGAEG